MQYAVFDSMRRDGIDFGFDSSMTILEYNQHCVVNDLIALPLISVSPMYVRDAIIEITRPDTDLPIASLVTCKGQEFTYGAASAELVVAYLSDASPTDILDAQGNARRDFKFLSDYLVLSHLDYDEYISTYRAGSGIWGSFTHPDDQHSRLAPYTTRASSIAARPDIRIDTDAQRDAVWRTIAQASPLERFLKLYHLLELNFDLMLVEEIKRLGSDLKGIGKLLNSYSGDKEIDRLTKVIRKHCTDMHFFERVLGAVFNDASHHQQLLELLFEYSKDANPYKEQAESFKKAISSGFSRVGFAANKLQWDYERLSRLTAYFVYRVRSSIAHLRIGEYLFSSADEGFVSEIAEPLLREILSLVYKAQTGGSTAVAPTT
ncbi:MAG: hypothetical protein K0M39_12615 [Rhizobium sp.]|nr:hypothetical protein [Rhizobium sp.]